MAGLHAASRPADFRKQELLAKLLLIKKTQIRLQQRLVNELRGLFVKVGHRTCISYIQSNSQSFIEPFLLEFRAEAGGALHPVGQPADSGRAARSDAERRPGPGRAHLAQPGRSAVANSISHGGEDVMEKKRHMRGQGSCEEFLGLLIEDVAILIERSLSM